MALSVSGFPEPSRPISGLDPNTEASSLMNSPRLRGLFGKRPHEGLKSPEPAPDAPPPSPPPPQTPSEYDLHIEMPMPIPPLPPLGRPKRPQPLPPIPRQTTASPVRLQPSLGRLEIGRQQQQKLQEWSGSSKSAVTETPLRPLPMIPTSESNKNPIAGPSNTAGGSSKMNMNVSCNAGPSSSSSKSPPPIMGSKLGSTYQQHQHQRTPSSKVLLATPSPPRNNTNPPSKMRYQPLVVDPPPPPSASSSSSASSSLSSASAAPSSSISETPSSSTIRPLPRLPPLKSAPLTSGRYIPPPPKVRRPRTSPSSISVFSSSSSPPSGIPISWASRPVDLNPCGSSRITTQTPTRRRDHSADSFLARFQLANQQQRRSMGGMGMRNRSTSRRRHRSGPSPLRSSITSLDPVPPLPLSADAVSCVPPMARPQIVTGGIMPSVQVLSPTPIVRPAMGTAGRRPVLSLSGATRPVFSPTATAGGGRPVVSLAGTRPGRAATLPESPTTGGAGGGGRGGLTIQTSPSLPIERDQTLTDRESLSPPVFTHPFAHSPTPCHLAPSSPTLSSPSSPLEFFVDDKNVLSHSPSSSSPSRSPSPMRYARPDDEEANNQSSADEEEEVVGALTERRRKRRRRSQLRSFRNSYRAAPDDPPSPMQYAPPEDELVSPVSAGASTRRKTLPRTYRVDYGPGRDFVPRLEGRYSPGTAGRQSPGGHLPRLQGRHSVPGIHSLPGSPGTMNFSRHSSPERKSRSRSRVFIPERKSRGEGKSRGSIPVRGGIPVRGAIPIPKRKFADVSMAFFEDGLRGRKRRGKGVPAVVGIGAAGGVVERAGEGQGEQAFVLDISLEAGLGSGSSSAAEKEEESSLWKKKKKKKSLRARERTDSASGSGSSVFTQDADEDDERGGEEEEEEGASSTPFMWVSRSKPVGYQSTPIIPIPIPIPVPPEDEVPNNLSCGLQLLSPSVRSSSGLPLRNSSGLPLRASGLPIISPSSPPPGTKKQRTKSVPSLPLFGGGGEREREKEKEWASVYESDGLVGVGVKGKNQIR